MVLVANTRGKETTTATLPEDWYTTPRPLPHRWVWKPVPGDQRHWVAVSSHGGLMAEVYTAGGPRGWAAIVGEAIRRLILGRAVTVTGFGTRQKAVQAAERAAVAVGIARGRRLRCAKCGRSVDEGSRICGACKLGPSFPNS